jgi:hypothetical protein
MCPAFCPIHIAFQIITFSVVTAFVAWLMFAKGIDNLDITLSRKNTIKTVMALGFVFWYGLIFTLARGGTFKPAYEEIIPNVVIAIVIPVAAGLLLMVSGAFKRVLDAIPIHWFAGFHASRIVFGYAFLAIYDMGELPAEFALQAGYGDVATGMLGAAAAYLYVQNKKYARKAAIIWNVVGLVDFLLVLPLGIRFIHPDMPVRDFYPFYLIPCFVVPLFLLTHFYSIRALLKDRT